MISKLQLLIKYYNEQAEELQHEINSVVGTKEQFRVKAYLEQQTKYESFVRLLEDLLYWEQGECIADWIELDKQLAGLNSAEEE